LANGVNQCYAAAVVQLLLACPSIATQLAKTWTEVLWNMGRASEKATIPDMQFRHDEDGAEQMQDASEFLVFLLDTLDVQNSTVVATEKWTPSRRFECETCNASLSGKAWRSKTKIVMVNTVTLRALASVRTYDPTAAFEAMVNPAPQQDIFKQYKHVSSSGRECPPVDLAVTSKMTYTRTSLTDTLFFYIQPPATVTLPIQVLSWRLVGMVLFRYAHYTALTFREGHWYTFDSLDARHPVPMSAYDSCTDFASDRIMLAAYVRL
jgi:hypothetical protein